MRALRSALERLFSGSVPFGIFFLLRVGTGILVLARTTDLLRGVIEMDHHRWVRGFESLWSVPEGPALVSPLIPGFHPGAEVMWWLALLRTLLAVTLCLGVFPRLSALGLALVGYALLAPDRFRYFHHLHLLYLTCFWLALAPLGARLSLSHWLLRAFSDRLRLPQRGALRDAVTSPVPAWSLQLLRAFVISIYVAAGVSKLDPAWLSGETLRVLHGMTMLSGASFALAFRVLDYSGIAWTVCVTELVLLPLLLRIPHTRRWGVVVAAGFHLAIGATMSVSTFGVQMVLLAATFWPRRLPSVR